MSHLEWFLGCIISAICLVFMVIMVLHSYQEEDRMNECRSRGGIYVHQQCWKAETPEEHVYTHRLGDLYDRLSAALGLPDQEAYDALIDICAEFDHDDVVWMLNVIKDDLS